MAFQLAAAGDVLAQHLDVDVRDDLDRARPIGVGFEVGVDDGFEPVNASRLWLCVGGAGQPCEPPAPRKEGPPGGG